MRKEKVQVLRSLKCFNPNEIKESFVRGQYDGGMMNNEFVPAYRNEPNVNSQSNTETFVAGKIEIENSKWASVTFYIRTEKRMKKIYPNRYRV
ncbi:MAG: hypothetical protein E6830_02255 [Staphylococcus epidermidis]|nr:hypothetical protein [Staphylococcus epidermidis]MDU1612952.1 hypothetical protein [Staphylococcus epidermidis]MDU1641321.1 hypothetical protein [Staphylococcus epidermidis]